MKKVSIAIPTYTGQIEAETMISITRAMDEAREAGWQARVILHPRNPLIAGARNILVTQFLASDGTDLVWWDADIAATPGAFMRLLSHDLDLVAGQYRSRMDPETYIFQALPDPAEGPKRFSYKFDPETGLVEVMGVGCGFTRVTRKALEAVRDANPDLYINDAKAGKVPWLYDTALRNHLYFSEDFEFCRLWREIGGKVWIDPEIALLHTGPKVFYGHFGDHIRRMFAAAATEDELAAARQRLAEAGAEADRLMAAEYQNPYWGEIDCRGWRRGRCG